MKRHLITLAVTALCLMACNGTTTETYFQNPVIPADLADPSVIRVGDTYYAVGSSYNWAPMFPIYKSSDLVNWEQAGNIFDSVPEGISSGFWAPEFFQYEGRFYCFYSAGRVSDGKHCIGAAVADSPEGSYTDLGWVLDSGTEQIDAYVFEDSGTLYMTWKAHGLDRQPIEMSCSRILIGEDGISLTGETFMVLRDDEGIGMEGQCMFKRGDWYYVLYSAKSCCGLDSDYEVHLARAASVEGPWEKCPANPILSGGNDEVQSIGHGSTVETPDGRLFYLCHAYIKGAQAYLARRPFLSRLECTEDGWVACVTGPKAALEQQTPFPGTVQRPVAAFEADFAADGIDASWSSNVLCQSFNMLCQKAVATDYSVTAVLREEAAGACGLIFYGSDSDYAAIIADREEALLKVCFVSRGEAQTLASWPLPQGETVLSAEVSDAVNVTFSWNADGQEAAFALDRSLAPLMLWDSAFRPGIFSTVAAPSEAFRCFRME